MPILFVQTVKPRGHAGLLWTLEFSYASNVQVVLSTIFIIDFVGDHRAFGRHITRVRSCKLDGWTNEEAWIMEAIGNEIANSYYEFNMAYGFTRITPQSSDTQKKNYITDKYLKKKYIPEGEPEPIKLLYYSKEQGIAFNPEYAKKNSRQGSVILDGKVVPRVSFVANGNQQKQLGVQNMMNADLLGEELDHSGNLHSSNGSTYIKPPGRKESVNLFETTPDRGGRTSV